MLSDSTRISIANSETRQMGLMTIGADDFWAALDEYQEYDERTPQNQTPQVVVTTGDASVVQTGGHIAGNVTIKADRMTDNLSDISMDQLATELRELRQELTRGAADAADYVTIGAVAEAEDAASRDDRITARRALARAGRAALQGARDIGGEVAAAAISRSVGGA